MAFLLFGVVAAITPGPSAIMLTSHRRLRIFNIAIGSLLAVSIVLIVR